MANVINDISRFTNIDFGKVDAYTTDDGKNWFLLDDICEVLKIRRPELVIKEISDDEKGVTYINNIKYNVITIGGVFQLVIYSNSSKTEDFIKWLSYEVIPKLFESYKLNRNAKRLTTIAIIVPEYLRKMTSKDLGLTETDEYNNRVLDRMTQKKILENQLNNTSIYPF